MRYSGKLTGRKIFLYILLPVLIAGAAVLYFVYDPGEMPFFPRCPFLAVTGWQCPGCGSQRAVHSLLHGEIGAAWAVNPLLVACIPYLLLGFTADIFSRRYTWAAWVRKNLYGATAAWIVLAVVVLYTIARNIF